MWKEIQVEFQDVCVFITKTQKHHLSFSKVMDIKYTKFLILFLR